MGSPPRKRKPISQGNEESEREKGGQKRKGQKKQKGEDEKQSNGGKGKENVLHETSSTPGRDEKSTPPRARRAGQVKRENQRPVIEKTENSLETKGEEEEGRERKRRGIQSSPRQSPHC